MQITKKHIVIWSAVSIIIGLILLGIFYTQRRKNKSITDIKTRVDINTKPATANSYGNHAFYGSQQVYKDANGMWRILPGVCTLTETGIIDWAKIEKMPQLEKDTLYSELGSCKLQNLPLIQPI